MKVYLLTMYAVYDHGSGGVFTNREAAERHALALDAESDGHHNWRIDEMVLDEPVRTGPLAVWDRAKLVGQGRPGAIEFVPHSAA